MNWRRLQIDPDFVEFWQTPEMDKVISSYHKTLYMETDPVALAGAQEGLKAIWRVSTMCESVVRKAALDAQQHDQSTRVPERTSLQQFLHRFQTNFSPSPLLRTVPDTPSPNPRTASAEPSPLWERTWKGVRQWLNRQ